MDMPDINLTKARTTWGAHSGCVNNWHAGQWCSPSFRGAHLKQQSETEPNPPHELCYQLTVVFHAMLTQKGIGCGRRSGSLLCEKSEMRSLDNDRNLEVLGDTQNRRSGRAGDRSGDDRAVERGSREAQEGSEGRHFQWAARNEFANRKVEKALCESFDESSVDRNKAKSRRCSVQRYMYVVNVGTRQTYISLCRERTVGKVRIIF